MRAFSAGLDPRRSTARRCMAAAGRRRQKPRFRRRGLRSPPRREGPTPKWPRRHDKIGQRMAGFQRWPRFRPPPTTMGRRWHSRIAGTGSYLPAKSSPTTISRGPVDDERRVDRRAHRHSRAPHRGRRRDRRAISRLHAAGAHSRPRARGRRRRPHHRRDLHPGHGIPSSACLLQAKLGIRRGAAFDVQAVCAGFTYALATADLFIRTGYCYALVVGAEVFSRILDWKDRGTCVLFGDGAGASCWRPPPNRASCSRPARRRYLRGASSTPPGTVDRGGIAATRRSRWTAARSSASPCVVHWKSPRTMPSTPTGLIAGRPRRLIAHQANVRIISHAAEKLGLPQAMHRDRRPSREHLGRLHPARPRLAVRDGRIKPGHLVAAGGRGRRIHVGIRVLSGVELSP